MASIPKYQIPSVGVAKKSERSSRAVKARRVPNLLPTEAQEQKVLAHYLNHTFGYHGWIHPPNERKAHVQNMRNLSAMGTKSGIPDILIFRHVPFCCQIKDIKFLGIAIELKRQKGGRVSKNQEKWLSELDEAGWYTMVAYGAQQAIDEIERLKRWRP